jgi:hypothetical protein
VYQTGSVNNRATLWKNGVEQTLEGSWENPESLEKIPVFAIEVFVSGNDVYVYGSRSGYRAGGTDYHSVDILWKNGKAEILPYRQSRGDRNFIVIK